MQLCIHGYGKKLSNVSSVHTDSEQSGSENSTSLVEENIQLRQQIMLLDAQLKSAKRSAVESLQSNTAEEMKKEQIKLEMILLQQLNSVNLKENVVDCKDLDLLIPCTFLI